MADGNIRVGAVLMASGAARRFGANKLLQEVDGATMIERAMDAVPAGLFHRAAVVGAHPEILSLAEDRGYLAIPNPCADEGQSASIRLGASALSDMDGLLFAVCDQPWLTRESVRRLIAAFSRDPRRVCALSWQGRRGNPAVFPSALFPELAALRGDRGGAAIIRAHPELLHLVEAASPRELQDVDAPEDVR